MTSLLWIISGLSLFVFECTIASVGGQCVPSMLLGNDTV